MTRQDVSKTIIVLCAACVVGCLIFHVQWPLWVALVLMIGLLFEIPAVDVIARWWMRFGSFIGHINSRIVLSAAFYLILTPLAFIYRLFNSGPVEHFTKDRHPSYFENTANPGKEDLEKLW